MGAEQLQGTPWHPEQMHRVCKEGSKYCVYNRNKICVCAASEYHNKYCVGKGNCLMFEPKTGTPKVLSKKTIIIKQNPHNSKQPTEDMFSRPSLVTKHYTSYINEDKIKEDKITIMNNNVQDIQDNNKKPLLNEKHLLKMQNPELLILLLNLKNLKIILIKIAMSIQTKKLKKCLTLLKML